MSISARKLNIELVPNFSWGKSLARTLKRSEWDKIRKRVYARQNHTCGICGAGGMLLCHEQWKYDDEAHTQTLIGFLAVCNDCNVCIHIGRTGRLAAEGKIDMERVIAHYLRVNECTMEDYRLDNKQARLEWRERSKYGDWQTMIGDYNTLL